MSERRYIYILRRHSTEERKGAAATLLAFLSVVTKSCEGGALNLFLFDILAWRMCIQSKGILATRWGNDGDGLYLIPRSFFSLVLDYYYVFLVYYLQEASSQKKKKKK